LDWSWKEILRESSFLSITHILLIVSIFLSFQFLGTPDKLIGLTGSISREERDQMGVNGLYDI